MILPERLENGILRDSVFRSLKGRMSVRMRRTMIPPVACGGIVQRAVSQIEITLFRVNIDFQNVNIPNGMETDADKECARYEAKIKALGGVDLQLLGIGHNGHIGFNEPNGQFDRTTHCVNLTQSTIEANKRFFASEEDVPRQAYTMGIKTIMQANKILMVASGEDKAEIVKRAFFGPITPEVPASVLQLHNDVTLVGDEAALSLIGSCQS